MQRQLPKYSKVSRTSRFAVLAGMATFPFSLLAQSAQITQPTSQQVNQSVLVQVKILTDRVAALEQKLAQLKQQVATDEASGLNNPQPATPVVGEETPAAPAAAGGLSKADQARLSNMEKQISQLQEQQKGDTQTVNHPTGPGRPPSKAATTVVAPFQVLDERGSVIMSVEASNKGSLGGLKVYAPDGTFVQAGAGKQGWSAVRVYEGNQPRLFMGFGGASNPVVSLANKDGSTLVQIASQNKNGEIDFFNSSGKVSALIGADLETGVGHADFTSASGEDMVRINQGKTNGDLELIGNGKAFSAWDMMVLGLVPLRGAAAGR